jgi:CheY-like chemotaxis protein
VCALNSAGAEITHRQAVMNARDRCCSRAIHRLERSIASMDENALILVVDDEAESREPLVILLQGEGYRIATASNGRSALAMIHQQQPDLVLLDVTMPGMDGYELTSLIKSNPLTASIPVVLVTGFTGRGARVVGLNAGAEDILSKPVDAAELSLKVRNLLRLRAHSQSALSPIAHLPAAP